MSDGMRISRRKVMQMGLLTPVVALEARGASAAEVSAALSTISRLPDATKTRLKDKARPHCQANQATCGGPLDEQGFDDIVDILWTYLRAGIEHSKARVPESESAVADFLVDVVYEKLNSKRRRSGELIAERVHMWVNRYEHVTNYCAFRCGFLAGKRAGPGRVVEQAHYDAAFNETELEMDAMLARTGSQEPSRGGAC